MQKPRRLGREVAVVDEKEIEMTKVEIDSRVCGHSAVITTHKEGKVMCIHIDGSCEKISDFVRKTG